jgi:hypothetical protein
MNPKTEVAWVMGGELTTDYSDYTDYLVWNFSPFATLEKLQMEPISIRVICVICG